MLAKNAVIYGAADFFFRFISFAIFPIYANLFSVADYGTLELVGTLVSIVLLVAGCGLNGSVQRYYWDPTTTPERQKAIVTTGILVQMALGFCAVSLSAGFIFFFHHILADRYGISLTLALLALASIPLTLGVQYLGDVLRLQFLPWHYSGLSFIRNISGVLVGLFLILFAGMRLEGVFLGTVIGLSLGMVLAIYFVPAIRKGRFDRAEAVRLCSYGYPLVFAGIAYWLFGSMDRWMLSEMSSLAETGLYSIAFKISGVLQLLIVAFGQAWSPHSIMVYRDRTDYREVFGLVLSVWTMLLAAAAALITIFATELLHFLTPVEYHSAAPIVGWCAAGVALYGTTQVSAVGISLEKQTHLFARGAWIVALTNLLLNYLLIPRLGGLGAAIATFVSYAMLTALYIWWTQHLHPIKLQRKWLFAGFSIIAIVAVVGTFLPRAGYSAGLFVVKLLAVAFIAALVFRSSKIRNLVPNLFAVGEK